MIAALTISLLAASGRPTAAVKTAPTVVSRAVQQGDGRSAFGGQDGGGASGAYHRQGKDYALLIAVDDYANFPKLSNPVRDATRLADTLSSTYGFAVTLLRNPTRDDIADAIDKLSSTPFKDDDQLLVFFAGHGYYDAAANIGYLLAADAGHKMIQKTGPDGPHQEIATSSMMTFLGYGDFAKHLDALPFRHELLILDACFAGNLPNDLANIKPGPISKALNAYKRDVTEAAAMPEFSKAERINFIRNKMRKVSRIVLCSGDRAVPDGEPGRGSPFANYLRGALESRAPRGFVYFEQLYSDIELLPSEPRWAPILGYDTDGSFLFMKPEK